MASRPTPPPPPPHSSSYSTQPPPPPANVSSRRAELEDDLAGVDLTAELDVCIKIFSWAWKRVIEEFSLFAWFAF